MDAKSFIGKHGWNDARVFILNCASPADRWVMRHGDLVSDNDFDELKTLVDAYELVQSHGGIISAKKYLKFLQSSVDMGLYHGLDDVDYKTEIPLMEKAIKLVESVDEND